MAKYEIDVSIPFQGNLNALDVSAELERELKDRFNVFVPSSGAGFGFRDIQFEFDDLNTATQAVNFIEEFLHRKGYQITDNEASVVITMIEHDDFELELAKEFGLTYLENKEQAKKYLEEHNQTGVVIDPEEIVGLWAGPDSLGDVQKRRAVIIDHQVDGRMEVLEGEYWGSGYDERVLEEVNDMNLADGIYEVTFVPFGEEQGMDSTIALSVEFKEELYEG